MNRNVESHFSELPAIDIQRSIFDRSHTHKTSFDAGELIPIFIDEVLPGDTFRITTQKVIRAQTMLTPIMDNMYLDTYFFFIPMRLVWNHWAEFFGENTSSPWIQQTTYSIPQISSPNNGLDGFDVGTIADYLGIPTGEPFSSQCVRGVSHLPFRAYALVADQWFRDENLTYPLAIPLGDSNEVGSNGSNYITDQPLAHRPEKANEKHHEHIEN